MRTIHIVGMLLLSCMLPLLAQAQMLESQPVVASKSFSRDFSGGQVGCQLTARASGSFTTGQRALVQVDLDSGASEVELRTGVINGFVVFALPPGLEPDGQPRLLYYNEERERYDFMYSKAYPRLERFMDADEAFADAASNDPQRIRNGLAQISLALDEAVAVSGPASPRLNGTDRAYSLAGVSWLIPADVYMKEVVSLFNPEPGLYDAAKLRVVLQVKVTADAITDPIEVYAGGLSVAMHQMELLPSQLPPTAIPLVPIPATTTAVEPEPVEPIVETPASESAEPGSDAALVPEQPEQSADTPIQQPPSRPRTSRHSALPPVHSAGQDEQPIASAEGEQATPSQPIPAMVYSYEWISWETQFTPLAAVPEAGSQTTVPIELADAPAPSTGQFDFPEQPSTEISPDTPEDIIPVPHTEDVPRPVRNTQPAPAEPNGSSARQVELGTLPAEPLEYTVPLKEIGGTGTPSGGNPEFQLKPTGNPENVPGVITPQLPDSQMNLPAPEGLGEMILIPAGPFLMGTPSGQGGDADEQPQTEVDLPAYYIDKYPVTNRQFHNFVISAGYKPEGNWQKYYGTGTADLPVRGVSLADAKAFAKWAGKRLPTEAEWEKAARGTDGRTYPWGEDWSSDIMPRGEETLMYSIMTAPRSASPFGVMGMSGLVWHWTASPYAPYPFDASARSEKYVLRGGAYSNGRGTIRCANRYYEPGNVALNTFGFRCVKDAPSA